MEAISNVQLGDDLSLFNFLGSSGSVLGSSSILLSNQLVILDLVSLRDVDSFD